MKSLLYEILKNLNSNFFYTSSSYIYLDLFSLVFALSADEIYRFNCTTEHDIKTSYGIYEVMAGLVLSRLNCSAVSYVHLPRRLPSAAVSQFTRKIPRVRRNHHVKRHS